MWQIFEVLTILFDTAILTFLSRLMFDTGTLHGNTLHATKELLAVVARHDENDT